MTTTRNRRERKTTPTEWLALVAILAICMTPLWLLLARVL
jgi:hypothetical protein